MRQEDFKEFQDHIRSQKLDPAFETVEAICVMSGPCAVIEIVVAQAANDSGIPMDWGYTGGRAFIHAKGDRDKARLAICRAFPLLDLDCGNGYLNKKRPTPVRAGQ